MQALQQQQQYQQQFQQQQQDMQQQNRGGGGGGVGGGMQQMQQQQQQQQQQLLMQQQGLLGMQGQGGSEQWPQQQHVNVNRVAPTGVRQRILEEGKITRQRLEAARNAGKTFYTSIYYTPIYSIYSILVYCCTGGVLFHVEWCIMKPWTSSIILCNITSIAHNNNNNHHTDI